MNTKTQNNILTDIGLEVEKIEHVESIKGGLKGVVIGQILNKVQHPNADRLYLTNVKIDNDVTLQIICGASNIEVGQPSPYNEGANKCTSKQQDRVTILHEKKIPNSKCKSINHHNTSYPLH